MAPKKNDALVESDAKRGARAPGRRTEHFSDLVETGSLAEFLIEAVDLCVINSVRRAVISNVKTVAVEFDPTNPAPYDVNNPLTSGIQFKKNTSVVDNEKLGRQIALIPICVNENRLQGYDPNTYKFVLKVKNTEKELLTVKSSDIQVLDSTDAEVPPAIRDSLFPPCPITNDHILIVRLDPPMGSQEGGEIHVEFRARLGTGQENARWSPTCKCAYGFVRDDGTYESNFAAFIEKKKLEMDEGQIFKPEEIRRARLQYNTLEGQRDFALDENDNPLAIKFTLESVNGLSPTYLFFEGLRVLSKKMKDFMDEIVKVANMGDDDKGWGDMDDGSDAPPRVKVVQKSNMDDMYEITVEKEGHTLGNLVQGLLYRRWNFNGDKPRGAAFFGYTEPHRLEDCIVFSIKVNPGDKLGTVMEEGLRWCIDYVDDLALEFVEFSGLRKILAVDELIKSIKTR